VSVFEVDNVKEVQCNKRQIDNTEDDDQPFGFQFVLYKRFSEEVQQEKRNVDVKQGSKINSPTPITKFSKTSNCPFFVWKMVEEKCQPQ
jgi:hypothetical protein